MMTAAQIIAQLDGSAAIARETGFPLTTIEGWKEVNFIPAWRRDRLLLLAAKLDRTLAITDFPGAEHRQKRQRPAAEAAAA